VRLPDPYQVPGLMACYGISDPAQQELLQRASMSFWADPKGDLGDCLSVDDATDKRHVNPIVRSAWQSAEAIWLAVGLLPPVLTWPWPTLDRVVGSIPAGDVWVAGARTGEGKSTFVGNLIRLAGWPGRPRMTVVPLEVSPASVQLRLAALELGFPLKAIIRQEWSLAGVSPDEGRTQVQEVIRQQGEPPLREHVRYCPADTLDRRGFAKLVAEAAEWKHRLVVVDHLHHMDHGDGPEYRGIRKTMKLAKQLARQYDLAILFTAQLSRGDQRDRRRKFYPPELTDLQGASAIEQVADGVLLLYQALAAGTRATDIDAVLSGERQYRSVFKPNALAVKCAKHRLDGSVRNQTVELLFDEGEIRDSMPSYPQGDAWEPGNG
jgi:replicative DNA helicase